MKLLKIVVPILLMLCYIRVTFAQVSGTGSIVVLVAATPTTTPTPTPGGSTFSVNHACNTAANATGGCTFNGVSYGAGGIALPATMTNPTVVTCQNNSGDPGLLQTALNGGGTSGAHKQVLIEGSQCDMTSVVSVSSYTDVQCQNPNTVIFNPYGTASQCNNGGAAFSVNGAGVSGGITNVTFSNCTYNGINTQPPYYPGGHPVSGNTCSSGTYAIILEGVSSCSGCSGPNPVNNITIEDNLFKNCTGQACIEMDGANGNTPATPGAANFLENWNTFDNCALYGPQAVDVGTSAGPALSNHNYLIDCRLGNENDNATEKGVSQLNYNYIRRRTSYGYNYVYNGCGPTTLDAYCQFFTPTSCSMTGNIMDPAGAANGCSTFGSSQGIIEFGSSNSNSTYSQNYCNTTNGSCSCDSISSGCTSTGTVPNPAPSGP